MSMLGKPWWMMSVSARGASQAPMSATVATVCFGRPPSILTTTLFYSQVAAQIPAMDSSRPSSPDAPPQDLWSSILDSVSTSRSIPSKQVILLGEPSSGKSTLVSALLQKPPPDETKEDQRTDFAIGYDWAGVRDDAEEGTYASRMMRQRLY